MRYGDFQRSGVFFWGISYTKNFVPFAKQKDHFVYRKIKGTPILGIPLQAARLRKDSN